MSKNTDSVEELLPCPGKRLKMAREAKGMDAAQAAEQLHLSRAMVNALEAEDYDRLPARVFVRGYYRNYARLMEVPEEIILQDVTRPDGSIVISSTTFPCKVGSLRSARLYNE
jgi:DNA-binding XRE family transcriptional regulator